MGYSTLNVKKMVFWGIFSEHPMKDMNIKLAGCDERSLKIHEKFFFIYFI